jgi:3-hydroxypropanoate dehydrogenase
MPTQEPSVADVNRLFLDARTHSAWLDKPVSDELLRRVYDVARMGPTSANNQAMRVVYVKSPAAKEKLRPFLSPGNVDKTMAAPATAIIAYDLEFYEKMPKLFPQADMKKAFQGMPEEKRERSRLQSSSLQGAYMILAARALGLDCGPMGGFDNAKVDEAFFPDGKWKSNFLLNLGYGDATKLFPRNPRLDFDEACRIE